MNNDSMAFMLSDEKAPRGPASVPRTAVALRFLLTAWLLDDNTHWTPMHEALAAHLKDRAWVPSAEDYQMFHPGLMAWAARYEMMGLVNKALGGNY